MDSLSNQNSDNIDTSENVNELESVYFIEDSSLKEWMEKINNDQGQYLEDTNLYNAVFNYANMQIEDIKDDNAENYVKNILYQGYEFYTKLQQKNVKTNALYAKNAILLGKCFNKAQKILKNTETSFNNLLQERFNIGSQQRNVKYFMSVAEIKNVEKHVLLNITNLRLLPGAIKTFKLSSKEDPILEYFKITEMKIDIINITTKEFEQELRVNESYYFCKNMNVPICKSQVKQMVDLIENKLNSSHFGELKNLKTQQEVDAYVEKFLFTRGSIESCFTFEEFRKKVKDLVKYVSFTIEDDENKKVIQDEENKASLEELKDELSSVSEKFKGI